MRHNHAKRFFPSISCLGRYLLAWTLSVGWALGDEAKDGNASADQGAKVETETKSEGNWVGTTTSTKETRTTGDPAKGTTTRETETVTGKTSGGRTYSTTESRATTYERNFGNKPKDSSAGKGEADDDKQGVEVGVKIYENTKKGETELWETGSGFADKSIDGTETSGSQKVQVGQAGGQYGVTVGADKDGLKVEAGGQGEVNVIKGTIERKAETKIADGVSIASEGKVAGTVGADAKAKGSVQVGPDKIKTEGEIGIFVGAKVKGEASGTLDLKDSLGISFTGKVEGDVRVGVGAELKGDAELSWTKIKISGGGSLTKGLGFGGKGSIEIDATKLITGVDMDKVDAADKKSAIIADMVKKIKNGEYTMPEGKKLSDMLDDIHTNAEWLVKNPQIIPKGEDGKPRNSAELIMEEMGFDRGPNYGKVPVAPNDSGSGDVGASPDDDGASPGAGVGLPHPDGGTDAQDNASPTKLRRLR